MSLIFGIAALILLCGAIGQGLRLANRIAVASETSATIAAAIYADMRRKRRRRQSNIYGGSRHESDRCRLGPSGFRELRGCAGPLHAERAGHAFRDHRRRWPRMACGAGPAICRPFAPDPCAAAPSAALWAANRWLRAARLRPASGRRHDRRCSRPQKAVGGDGHHEMSDLGAVCERVHRVCREG